jgi:hypothetical protein
MFNRIITVLWAIVLSLVYLWSGTLPVLAQAVPSLQSNIPTQTYQIQTDVGPQNVDVLNFADLSFNQFPSTPIDQAFLGQLEQINPGANLSHLLPGTEANPTQYLSIGSIAGGEAFGVGQMSLEQIANTSGVNIANTKLGELGDIVRQQTPAALLQDLPQLANLGLDQVKPIQDLAIQFFNAGGKLGNLEGILGGTGRPDGNIPVPEIPGIGEIVKLPPELQDIRNVGELVNKFPDLAKSPLKLLGDNQLMKYDLKAIPGLAQAPLDQLTAADGAFLKDLGAVGFGDIPLGKLPVPPNSPTASDSLSSMCLWAIWNNSAYARLRAPSRRKTYSPKSSARINPVLTSKFVS